jgi:hypothetical protein
MAGLFVVGRPEVAGRGPLQPDHGSDRPANDYEDVGEGNEEEKDVAHGVRSLQRAAHAQLALNLKPRLITGAFDHF